MVMATQTYVTDMQAINPIQQVQQQATTQAQSQNVQPSGTQVKVSGQNQGQATTIIQPSQAHSGQQFIVTTVSGDPSNEQVQEAVQLQQGTGQVVYQPQQTYSNYNDAATMYTPVSGTYYQTSQMSGQGLVSGIQGQILTHQGSTYVVQGGTVDGEGHPFTHTTRASPATVQWLIDNYETAEGVSLPRSTLYSHYLRHCQEQKIDPMNPASFGKLIRSVFLGLRTRRLGTRGNSKYHYYGIRIKATSPLNQYTDDQTMAIRQQPINAGKREFQDGVAAEHNTHQHQHLQFLGDAAGAIPDFGTIEINEDALPDGITFTDLAEFEELYKEHCEAILDIVVNLQFSLIEALWQSFWRTLDSDESDAGDMDDQENRLSKEKLFRVCRIPEVLTFISKSDYAFYQAIVEVLIPDVLRPIPSSLTQAIRNFAKSLEGWLKSSTEGVPDEMVKIKLGAVSAFGQTLRRYTSLNHLAQAARAVLQNTTQIGQMLTDLNRVDFTNVQEQASWVCQCEDDVVHQLEQDFKKTLQQQKTLEQWAEWLEGVVHRVLKPYEGLENFPKAARQFLLKWSFYSSMVIRDLTLRSAASFGSFHLIRLLYDEYMFYLVEHKVANVTGETPIAVMGEVRQFIDLGPVMTMGAMAPETKPVPASTNHTTTILKPTAATTILKQTATMNGQPQTLTALPKSIVVTSSGLNHGTLTSLGSQLPSSTKSIVVAPSSLNHGNFATISNQLPSLHASGLASTGQVVSQVHALVNNPSGLSVVTSSGNQPKTIVVVPVSVTTPGGGDAQPIKKLKTS